MLSIKEENFIEYWSKKRLENKANPLFFLKGFTAGILVGVMIFLCMGLGWYKRANMVASTKLNPVVLFFGLLIISLFLAIFYNNFRYEQNEQAYQELLQKKKKLQ